MRLLFRDVPTGLCFTSRNGAVRKKIGDRKIATVHGLKVRTRTMTGNPKVQAYTCPLRFLGIGLKMGLIEMGDSKKRAK